MGSAPSRTISANDRLGLTISASGRLERLQMVSKLNVGLSSKVVKIALKMFDVLTFFVPLKKL